MYSKVCLLLKKRGAEVPTYSNLSEGLLANVQSSVKLSVKCRLIGWYILVECLLIRSFCYVCCPPGLCFSNPLCKHQCQLIQTP